MERNHRGPNYRIFYSLFYIVSLFAITILMIHFIHYNSDKKAPRVDKVVVVAEDYEEPVKIPLPEYDFNSLPLCNLTKAIENPKLNLKEIQKSFLKCVFPLLARFFGNPEGILFNFNSVLSVCDEEPETRDIEVREFGVNSWAVLPKCKENNTLVTLGVENENVAEDWLKEKIPNLKMFGTSGFLESSQVYENFQTYAIGREGDTLTMETMENNTLVNKTMPQKRFEEYVSELKLTKIDNLWINAYYGTYPFWDALKQDGWLKKHGISVCQAIIEVPKGHGNQWTEMIKPMQLNSEFVFLRPTTTKSGGARAFFINYKDPQCTRKYLEL